VVGFNRALPYLVRGQGKCRGCHLRDLMLAEARLTIPIIVVLLQPSDLVRLLGRTAKVTVAWSRAPLWEARTVTAACDSGVNPHYTK
jgi:hypothetical protein